MTPIPPYRSSPPPAWEVAARLEDAALAVKAASKALDAAYAILLSFHDTDGAREIPGWAAIKGTDHVDAGMVRALKELSDEYQAIADAENVL